jgi:hypothetical protein
MRKILFGLFSARSVKAGEGTRRAPRANFRPTVEDLESRLVLSHAPAMPTGLGSALASRAAMPAPTLPSPVVPINVTGVSLQNGQLVANGLLGNIPFTAPLTLSPSAASTAATPILHLRIDPIHLNLLGLKVDTSPICLDITAQPGTLLGGLLGQIAGGLSSGTPLGSILGGLSSTDLNTVTTGLTGLINGVLGDLTSPSSVGRPAASHGRTTNILHLSLGPVDLNLLGLNVHLDNCSNGPVTLDISAQRGPGNLLGNLLSGLAHSLDRNHTTRATDRILTGIADELFSL